MPTPEEEEAALIAAESGQSGPAPLAETHEGATGPVDDIPGDFKDLMDAAREIEPRLKDSDTLPSGPVGPRGPDGKFLPRTALATGAEPSGATGPEGATGPSGATGAASGATGASGAVDHEQAIKADPQMRPSTRKVIDGMRGERDTARTERDTARMELQTVQAKVTELETKLKTIKAPKEMEEELEALRAQVRTLDISKDPAIVKKYDAKIKSNGESALGLLKDFGIFTMLDKDKKPIEMSEAEKKSLTESIEKSGFGIRGMARYIKALESADQFEAAERLRQIASQNDQLARDKDEEVATWNKDYEGLQAERARETQAQSEAYLTVVKTAGETLLNQDLQTLAKEFPHINPPPAVLPTDSAEVKAAKEKALGEFQAATKALEEDVKLFNADGQPPEKAAQAYGKLQAAAITSVVIRKHILPKLQADLKEAVARATAAEAEVAKVRKAGNLNRAHSAAITAPANGSKAPSSDLSLEAAARQIAAESGIKLEG